MTFSTSSRAEAPEPIVSKAAAADIAVEREDKDILFTAKILDDSFKRDTLSAKINSLGIKLGEEDGSSAQAKPCVTPLDQNLGVKTPEVPGVKPISNFGYSRLSFHVVDVPGVTDPLDKTGVLISASELKGKQILSLGEGESGLVPLLVKKGVDAYGIDIADEYKDKSKMKLPEEFKKRLMYADATNFAGSELAMVSFDHVVSTCLFCCLDETCTVKALTQSVKSLKPGGTSRHMWSYHNEGNNTVSNPKYFEALKQVREKLKETKIDVTVHVLRVQADDDRPPFDLLIIKRVAPQQKP